VNDLLVIVRALREVAADYRGRGAPDHLFWRLADKIEKVAAERDTRDLKIHEEALNEAFRSEKEW